MIPHFFFTILNPHNPWVLTSQIIALVTLVICAVTDVILRRTSELLLAIAAVASLILHFSWINICVGVILALCWLYPVLKGEAGLGDLEMSLFQGIAFGVLAPLMVWVSVLFGWITKKLWPKLSTNKTPKDEISLCPVGFYYAIGAVLFFVIQESIC